MGWGLLLAVVWLPTLTLTEVTLGFADVVPNSCPTAPGRDDGLLSLPDKISRSLSRIHIAYAELLNAAAVMSDSRPLDDVENDTVERLR